MCTKQKNKTNKKTQTTQTKNKKTNQTNGVLLGACMGVVYGQCITFSAVLLLRQETLRVVRNVI